ncbi:MAG TPA: alpha/beta hydrolase-fold protein [Candidatus Saccharimonadales bacterium]|nr:alpha/beta hydrolase-fold protein [Candidatus Saccharimonadales bacterium]
MLVTVLGLYILNRLWISSTNKISKRNKKAQATSKKRLTRQLIIILVASLVLALLTMMFFAHEYGTPLPNSFIIMVLPIFIFIGLLVLDIVRKTNLKIITAVSLFVGILFSLILINNYYRFYPTLGQVFGKTNVANLGSNQKEALLSFSPSSTKIVDSQTIQGSLTSLEQQPTAGKVFSLNIPGAVSKFKARTAFVYEPAIYSNPSDINLPVIVLTAGYPGIPGNWLGSGLQATMDEFAKLHDGIAPIVFMVDNTGSLTNDTECVNSPRGNVETYLTVDVPNYIKSHFNVATDPSHWAIGGLSLGGMCAVMLALRHPDVYHYFLDFGGEIGPEIGSQQTTIDELFNGSEQAWAQHQPATLLSDGNSSYKEMGGFFAVGDEDQRSLVQAAQELNADSKQAGLNTVFELLPGQHTFTTWQNAFKLSLPWVSNQIGATECGSVCI